MEPEIVQLSSAWFAQRRGKVTASRVADVIATTKSGWGASRTVYMAELIAERLTGVTVDRFRNEAMQWGVDKEPDAKAAYAFYRDAAVLPATFTVHPVIADAGASPDGLIGEEGLLEIKCPQTNTHIDTLLSRCVPSKYITQMQFQMACTGRRWCDFASFDPRMPETMRLFVKRIERDEKEIAMLEKEITIFLRELSVKLQTLVASYGEPKAA